MTRLTGIYALADPRTGVVRYIGQAVDVVSRYRAHAQGRSRVGNVSAWVRLLWAVARRKPRLVVLTLCAREHLDDRERWWIAAYRRAGGLLNENDGGGGSNPSAHVRAKLSAVARRRMQDPVERAKISAAMRSPETRAKFSAAMRSPGTRAKISAANRRRYQDPAERAKLSAANRRRYQDPAARTKMADALRGRKLTPEHRAKISAARRAQERLKQAAGP